MAAYIMFDVETPNRANDRISREFRKSRNTERKSI